MGAGVANLVAANLVDKGYIDNVYCYTYASPNTFYWTDNDESNYREPQGVNYRCIFNIVNEDDFVPEVPMSKCGWTRYGRTAKISFNSNKSNIDTIIRNGSKYSIIHYDWTNTKRFINEQYLGDTKTIEDIVDSFNEIFKENPDNMRYDAYAISDNDYVVLYNSQQVIEAPMPSNTKPYQKIDTRGEDIKEYQMPAYFMQYIAYCMHGGFPIFNYDSSDIGFYTAKFTTKCTNTKVILIEKKSKIETSHYLESYYLLSKIINTLDFN